MEAKLVNSMVKSELADPDVSHLQDATRSLREGLVHIHKAKLLSKHGMPNLKGSRDF